MSCDTEREHLLPHGEARQRMFNQQLLTETKVWVILYVTKTSSIAVKSSTAYAAPTQQLKDMTQNLLLSWGLTVKVIGVHSHKAAKWMLKRSLIDLWIHCFVLVFRHYPLLHSRLTVFFVHLFVLFLFYTVIKILFQVHVTRPCHHRNTGTQCYSLFSHLVFTVQLLFR